MASAQPKASSVKRGKTPAPQPTVCGTPILNLRSTDPFPSVDLTYAGKRICFRRLLSNADAGTKRRSRLT
jgi:hypothetical protein